MSHQSPEIKERQTITQMNHFRNSTFFQFVEEDVFSHIQIISQYNDILIGLYNQALNRSRTNIDEKETESLANDLQIIRSSLMYSKHCLVNSVYIISNLYNSLGGVVACNVVQKPESQQPPNQCSTYVVPPVDIKTVRPVVAKIVKPKKMLSSNLMMLADIASNKRKVSKYSRPIRKNSRYRLSPY